MQRSDKNIGDRDEAMQVTTECSQRTQLAANMSSALKEPPEIANKTTTHLMCSEDLMHSKDLIISEGNNASNSLTSLPGIGKLSCILCMECIGDYSELQRHLIKNHEVKEEALRNFMSLVDFRDVNIVEAPADKLNDTALPTSDGTNSSILDDSHKTELNGRPNLTSTSSFEESNNLVIDLGKDEEAEMTNDGSPKNMKDKNETENASNDRNSDNKYNLRSKCNICFTTFMDFEELFKHQIELGHLRICQMSVGPSYLCWQDGCNNCFPKARDVQIHYLEAHLGKQEQMGTNSAIADRLMLKCNHCDLEFKKRDDLETHHYCHEMEKAMECSVCCERFQSIMEFRKHKQAVHLEELTAEQQELYEASLAAASSLALLGASGLEDATVQALKVPFPYKMSKAKDQSKGHNLLLHHVTPVCESFTVVERVTGNRLDENSNKFEVISLKESGVFSSLHQNSVENEVSGFSCSPLKCHTCNVSFLKTHELLEHEETDQHKKKLIYKNNSFFPFKCSHCSESFEALNDLQKHFNSVQHGEVTHKLNQLNINTVLGPHVSKAAASLMESSVLDLTSATDARKNKSSTLSPVTSIHVPSKIPVTAVSFAPQNSQPHNYPSSLSLLSAERPFRCSVCKVSYSKKSQLNDHLASQQHLSRSAKASDVSARQLLSTTAFLPTPSVNDQNEQMDKVSDLLHQKQKLPITPYFPFAVPFFGSLLSPLMTNNLVASSALIPNGEMDRYPHITAEVSGTVNHSSIPMETSNPELKTKQESPEKTEATCIRCHKVFPSTEVLTQHQEFDCTETSPGGAFMYESFSTNRSNQTTMESILQGIGYECVKQYTEFRQKRRHMQTSTDAEGDEKQIPDSQTNSKVSKVEKGILQEDVYNKLNINVPMPEVNLKEAKVEYVCSTCLKQFSSIFILKAHQEEVHKEIIPFQILEKLQSNLRANYDKLLNRATNDAGPSEKTRVQGLKRPEMNYVTNSQVNLKEEQMKQHQQLQLAAAFQSMQLQLMMSMGLLPQVYPHPGPGPVPSISELITQQPFSIIDPVLVMQLQQQQTKVTASINHTPPPIHAPPPPPAAMQKSARTRISEQQLAILRANFDIRNSPTEEQIQEMSEKTGLATKVIKHWFRNTLFKERQHNKDSPYNFSVPPSTTLNLEEYERSQKVLVKKESLSSLEENDLSATVHVDLGSRLQMPGTSEVSVSLVDETTAGCNLDLVKTEEPSISVNENWVLTRLSQENHETSAAVQFNQSVGLVPNALGNLYGLSTPMNWQERRAGRTRFSNHQIQVLQEFFDRNPYPKDDEVERLACLLNLSVRVVVVWFQNARQRARKSENQAASTENTKQTLFQCGKCLMTFEQQVDLSKHQTAEHGENDFISHPASHSDSNVSDVFADDDEGESRSSHGNEQEVENVGTSSNIVISRAKEIECDKCDAVFESEEHLIDHQGETHGNDVTQESGTNSIKSNQTNFFQGTSDDGSVCRQSSDDEEHRHDRRMRTTLAQEQLDYLYERYAYDSNPTRQELELMAKHLNLKTRVVQVWFQNTRARERRGQYRAGTQKTMLKCPLCQSTFRTKPALEAHVITKHTVHMGGLPNPEDLNQTSQVMSPSLTSGVPAFLSPIPFMNGPIKPSIHTNMQYLYEKSLKQYMTKLSGFNTEPTYSGNSLLHAAQAYQGSKVAPPSLQINSQDKSKLDDGPLDLTISSTHLIQKNPKRNQSEDYYNSVCVQPGVDDSYLEVFSENDEAMPGTGDGTSPPCGYSGVVPSRHGSLFGSGKRYRTQMSTLQIKVMRAIFMDYKTPSLSECELLGQEIGLSKRVVQVWFQNCRAKEKKSNFPVADKSPGSTSNTGSGVFPTFCGSPTKCKLCNITYSMHHTMQDHLFTKMHIERLKITVDSSDFSRSMFNFFPGSETESFSQNSLSSDAELSVSQPLSLSNKSGISSTRLESTCNIQGNDIGRRNLTTERRQKRAAEKMSKEQSSETEKLSQSTSSAFLSSVVPFAYPTDANLGQFLGIPTSSSADLVGAMVPYLYPAGGIPTLLQGVPSVQLLSQAPNIIPGISNVFFNSALCGIPLIQLQIPKKAIELIQERLRDKACIRAHYSEDCLNIFDSESCLSPDEYIWFLEHMIHVGYICKKCHLVFPQAGACNAHLITVCCKDTGKVSADCMLILEQLKYQCSLCKDDFATVMKFRDHCDQEKHKKLASSEKARKNNSNQMQITGNQSAADRNVNESTQSESVSSVDVK